MTASRWDRENSRQQNIAKAFKRSKFVSLAGLVIEISTFGVARADSSESIAKVDAHRSSSVTADSYETAPAAVNRNETKLGDALGTKDSGKSVSNTVMLAANDEDPGRTADSSAESVSTNTGADSNLPDMTVKAREWDAQTYNVPDAATATKVDTPIMETPLNIQVVPQQVLRDQQVIRIDKALQNISGVYGPNTDVGFQNGFNLRGFDTFDYYRNGVRVVNGGSTPVREIANIDRIEVLKGPASILYGRLEPGGLINLVTKQPLATPYHAMEQQFGSLDYYRTTIDTTGPLTQSKDLLYRVNLAYENAGSHIDFLDKERVFLAPTLRWNLSPRTEANAYLEYQHSNNGYNIFNFPTLNNQPFPLRLESNVNEPSSRSITDEIRVGFNWSHAFNDQWTLRQRFDANLIDFPQRRAFVPVGFSNEQCTAQQCRVERTAQDVPLYESQYYYTTIDLTGHFETAGLQHTLLLGGDYWREHNVQRFISYTAPPIDVIDFRPVHTGIPTFTAADITFDGLQASDGDWYGFFLQDQVKLPYGFQVLAGFRYDNASNALDAVDNTPGADNARTQDTYREDAIKPRFGLLWQPLQQLSLYGNYVENFGISNGRSVDRLLPPTTAQQWEAGLKTELLDGRFTGTLAWFDLTKQNIATPNPDRELAARGFQVATGEVRNKGIELDISGEIWPDVRAIGSYAYIDSAVTRDVGVDRDADDNVIGTNAGNTGHRLAGVPRHGGSFWVTYEPSAGQLQGLKLGAGMIARDKRPNLIDNLGYFPGYALVNLMAGYSWKLGHSKVLVQLSIDNLLDKQYLDQGIQFATPRTFLGSLRLEM